MTAPVPNPPTETELAQAAVSLDRLVATLNTVLFGQEDLIELVVTGVLARGHLLLEGLPGLGKTELVGGDHRSADRPEKTPWRSRQRGARRLRASLPSA